MTVLRRITDSVLVVLPIIFIERSRLDHISIYFILWTVINVYFSLHASDIKAVPAKSGPHAVVSAASTQLAYLTASVDVRFIHVSDNIPLDTRLFAAALYSALIITGISVVSLKGLLFIKTQRPARTILHVSTAMAVIAGQMALNSKISVIAVLPAAAAGFYGIKYVNKKGYA